VISITKDDKKFVINEDIDFDSLFGTDEKDLTLNVVSGAIPQFSVEYPIEGEDSYTYDIYFTGRHIHE